MPILAIVGIFAAIGALGFGDGNGIDRKQVRQEVTSLLAGIPQKGATLGSPKAPITLHIFGDLECPTVRRFVVAYLPSIIDRWVRSGAVNLDYLSLETDTVNEHTFFRQETAALAAGRQDRMWDFILTFVHEQGQRYTEYASESFLADIASQVPGLKEKRWRHDLKDPLLSRRVALGIYFAHARGLHFTPSVSMSLSGGGGARHVGASDTASIRREVESSLQKDLEVLAAETYGDNPTFDFLGTWHELEIEAGME